MPTTTNYDIVVDPSLIESRPNNINSIQSPLQLPQQLELPLSLHLEPSQLLSAASSSAYPSQLPSQASTSSLLQQSPSNNLSLPLLDRIIESKQTKSKPIKKKLTKSQQSQQQQQQQRVLSLEESNANAIATANARTNQILDQAVRFVTATALGVTSTSTANHSNDDDNNFDNLLLESMVSRSNEGVIEEEGIEEGRIENSVSHDLNSFMERLVSNELRLGKGKLVVENSDSILSSAEEGQFQDDNRVIEHQLNQLLSQRTTEEEEGEELEGEEIDYGLKANGKPRKKRGRPKGKKDDPTLKLDGKFRGRPQGTKNVKGYKADILAKAYAEGTLLPPVPKKRGRPVGGKNLKKDPIHSLPVDEFGNIIQYAANGYDIEGYENMGSHPREAEYREAIDRYGAIEVLNRYQNEQYRAVAEAAAALSHQVQEEEE